jgi:hypothetical protein
MLARIWDRYRRDAPEGLGGVRNPPDERPWKPAWPLQRA